MRSLKTAVLSTLAVILSFCTARANAEWLDQYGKKFPTLVDACTFHLNEAKHHYGKKATVTMSLTYPYPLPSGETWPSPTCFIIKSDSRATVSTEIGISPSCTAGSKRDRNALSGCVPTNLPERPPTTVNIFIGGLFDSSFHPVEGYLLPNNPVQIPNHYYFSHSPESTILEFIAGLPAGTIINIVGHSYGGDTAVTIAGTSGRPIHLLITIDPVNTRDSTFPKPSGPPAGRPSSSGDSMETSRIAKFKALRPNTKIWIDVNSHPSESDGSSDTIAFIGGKWGNLPDQPIKYDDIFIDAIGLHHADFKGMMRCRGLNGKSAQDMLLGN